MSRDLLLDRYLSYDVATTAACAPFVRASIENSAQVGIYNLDVALARVGRDMSRIGFRINPERRRAFATEYTTKAEELQLEFLRAAGREVNPRSPTQLRKLFYEDFGLPILDEHRTDTGEPSTDEPTLLELLGMGVTGRPKDVIHALLGYRAADKIVGTYLGRFERDKDNPYQWFDAASGLWGGPPVHADGRTRTTWKVHGTKSGRWASGDPMNAQNVPEPLREMFEGNFVAADYSALELRILALQAGDKTLIDAFDAFDRGVGPDIHIVNACTIFPGCTPDKVDKTVRRFAKVFVYALGYGAQAPKIFQQLSLLRDDNLKPLFPGITLAEVERVFAAYWRAHPAITAYFSALIRGWRKHGFIATPWHERRRYFIGGEDHEQMKNHPIQGAGADLENTAVLKLVGAYPFDFARYYGLQLQGHDQLVVGCGVEQTDRVKGILKASMETQIGPMRFPAEVKTGPNWKAVS